MYAIYKTNNDVVYSTIGESEADSWDNFLKSDEAIKFLEREFYVKFLGIGKKSDNKIEILIFKGIGYTCQEIYITKKTTQTTRNNFLFPDVSDQKHL